MIAHPPTATRNLPADLKVLLAEDNEVNQLLATGILRHWGINAAIAATGEEVVKCMQHQDFDIILMDIQMPDKSGLEAAKDIRRMADEHKKNIPIIALTANGLKGEEKKYRAAGMNDFLVKPFNEQQLYDVVERVLQNNGSFRSENENVPPMINATLQPQVEARLYDMSQLEEIAAGNNDFLISLANIFLQTIPLNSSEMVTAANTGNWDMTSKLAHKLKSTIDSMNMYSIKTDIRTIELDAKNKKNTESLYNLTVKVNNTIQAVAKQLKADYSL